MMIREDVLEISLYLPFPLLPRPWGPADNESGCWVNAAQSTIRARTDPSAVPSVSHMHS